MYIRLGIESNMIKPTLLFLLLFATYVTNAQHKYPVYTLPDSTKDYTKDIVQYSTQWLNTKYKKLTRYADKENRRTARVLRKLSKKEKTYISRLTKNDTTQLQQLQHSPSYDSIQQRLLTKNTNKGTINVQQGMQHTLDSLRRIKDYSQHTLAKANNSLQQTGMDGINTQQLNELEAKLNNNQLAQQWIQERTGVLQKMGQASGYSRGLKGITKQSYYYRQQLNSYKRIANDPSVLEEKALQYLQGMEGFDKAISTPSLSSGQVEFLPLSGQIS